MLSLKNLPIKIKLFMAYALVYVTIFLLSFSLLFFQVQKNLIHRIKEELSRSNQTITDMVETAATISIKNHLRAISEKNREILEHLYLSFQKKEITEAEAKAQATKILLSQSVGDTGYIYCINSNGVAVVHPRKGVLGNDFSQRKFIQAQVESKTGYLEYDWKNPEETQLRPKALYMDYFEPWDWIISVSSYKSEFTGLIGIDDFQDRIVGLRFGETGYSFIIDIYGNIVIHPELSGQILDTRDANGRPIVEEMIRKKSGFMTYDWKNPSDKGARQKFIAFDFIPVFNWIIASSSYTREVFSPLDKMQHTFIFTLIAALIITGIVTLILSSSITRPLVRIILYFEKGARGDLTVRMDEKRKDEIGKLSAGFNLFMNRLETYRQELITQIDSNKETQKELSRLRNYLENIINSMPSALIGVDSNLNVTQWNKKVEELTGVPMTRAIKRRLSSAFPRMVPLEKIIRESMKEKGIRQVLKAPLDLNDGTTRYEDITIYPLTADGIQGAVIRIDDITDKVKMEEALIQNEKMNSVGGLAAGMAHEINNPLAGVIQNAQVLSNRLTKDYIPGNIKAAKAAGLSMASLHQYMNDRKIPQMIRTILDSGARMTGIVENMLGFARKSDTASSHHPADLMDKSLELAATDFNLNKRYDFKSIRIKKEYQDDLPLIVCEQSKIQQVLFNILNNGAHAMTENTQNTNRPPEFILRIGREKTSGMVRIEIEDNGPGMDKTVSKRIFEPFFTTKSVGCGTGLGLSIAYFIITDTHNGTLEIESTPGKGSKFIICLPVTQKNQRTAMAKDSDGFA